MEFVFVVQPLCDRQGQIVCSEIVLQTQHWRFYQMELPSQREVMPDYFIPDIPDAGWCSKADWLGRRLPVNILAGSLYANLLCGVVITADRLTKVFRPFIVPFALQAL